MLFLPYDMINEIFKHFKCDKLSQLCISKQYDYRREYLLKSKPLGYTISILKDGWRASSVTRSYNNMGGWFDCETGICIYRKGTYFECREVMINDIYQNGHIENLIPVPYNINRVLIFLGLLKA